MLEFISMSTISRKQLCKAIELLSLEWHNKASSLTAIRDKYASVEYQQVSLLTPCEVNVNMIAAAMGESSLGDPDCRSTKPTTY